MKSNGIVKKRGGKGLKPSKLYPEFSLTSNGNVQWSIAAKETLDSLGKAFSCWGGKIRLVCSLCYTEARCDLNSGEYLDEEAHRRAAFKLWRQGWRLGELPICPTCQKRKA